MDLINLEELHKIKNFDTLKDNYNKLVNDYKCLKLEKENLKKYCKDKIEYYTTNFTEWCAEEYKEAYQDILQKLDKE